MPLTKKQLKQLRVTSIPSRLNDIHSKQDVIITHLNQIQSKQKKISTWKHTNENHIAMIPTLISVIRDVLLPSVTNLTNEIKSARGRFYG